jgi:hypothetical protein
MSTEFIDFQEMTGSTLQIDISPNWVHQTHHPSNIQPTGRRSSSDHRRTLRIKYQIEAALLNPGDESSVIARIT